VVGFQVLVDHPGSSGDESSIGNIMVICSDNAVLLGDGVTFRTSKWSPVKLCPVETAVCAIRAQIQRNQGPGDDTGLNNVDLMCCPLQP